MCVHVNDLPRVATRQCDGQESNPRPADRKSSVLTTRPHNDHGKICRRSDGSRDSIAYPAALVGDPLRYPFGHDELDDPRDDVREEAINASPQVGDRQPVAVAEQRYDATPVYATFAKQPDNKVAQLVRHAC